jgi:predicted CopG family antitoxin
MRNMRLRNIAISDDSYNSLKDLGKFGNSFDDVIRKLILVQREVQKQEKCNERQLLESEDAAQMKLEKSD